MQDLNSPDGSTRSHRTRIVAYWIAEGLNHEAQAQVDVGGGVGKPDFLRLEGDAELQRRGLVNLRQVAVSPPVTWWSSCSRCRSLLRVCRMLHVGEAEVVAPPDCSPAIVVGSLQPFAPLRRVHRGSTVAAR
jgi:hypothetical protein